jgi:hypothetical protein
MYNYIVHNVKNNTVHTVLDAPIVIVRAAAWFIILLVQIANKVESQKKNLNFCGRKCGRS